MENKSRSSPNPPDFLTSILGPARPGPLLEPDDPTRPYVTLTFAQSLDAKIAGQQGKQLILSGMESMIMTHWMRTMHDAILVGIGTALNDDPQLNTRHLPLPILHESHAEHQNLYHLPRPVILDSNLRLRVDCKLLRNYRDGRGRRPWILCSSQKSTSASVVQEWSRRKDALEAAGARAYEVPIENGLLSIPAILQKLRELDIRSVMVEGGATVIGSFLAKAQGTGTRSVDTIIVTTAPTFVGEDGVTFGIKEIPTLQHIRTEVIGKDAVMAMKLAP